MYCAICVKQTLLFLTAASSLLSSQIMQAYFTKIVQLLLLITILEEWIFSVRFDYDCGKNIDIDM